MKACNTINIMIIPLELSQQADFKHPLTMVAMNDQLSDLTDDLVVVLPTTSKASSAR